MPETAPDLQELTLRAFTVLYHLREDWGGELILSCGLGSHGSALSLASTIAGAACLTIEPDLAVARLALRLGVCDFLVNTLDEALRALKNRVRLRAPLSVALHAEPTPTLHELLSRSLAPRLFTDLTQSVPIKITKDFMQNMGAIIVDFDQALPNQLNPIHADSFIATVLHKHDWHMESFRHPTLTALHAFDTQALNIIPSSDTFRHKWLCYAAKVLPRNMQLHRSLFVTNRESALLRDFLVSR